MTEPLLQMERAFFERLALVRSGRNSIRRSMAASSFYAAAEAVRAKKNGGLDFSKPPFPFAFVAHGGIEGGCRHAAPDTIPA